MKALLTGASGFIGKHLTQYLKSVGCEVHSLGRTKIDNVIHYSLSENIVHEDIKSIIEKIEPDYLFHLAGSVQENPLSELFKLNVLLATSMLDALDSVGLAEHTRVLVVGSAAEYGFVSEAELPVSEETVTNPTSLYGISKLAQTQMSLAWANKNNKKVVVARPFTVMGPGMPSYLAIGSFARQINDIVKHGGRGRLVTGNIDVSRDFLHVRDLVKILWKLINADDAYGKVVNVCSGNPVSLSEIVSYMIEFSECKIELYCSKERLRLNDMKIHYGDNKLMHELAGELVFTPWKTSLDMMLTKHG